MGLTLAKCPACGAELNLEIDRDYFYCPHCGSKVLHQDNRIVIEHVNRTIDEAEVRRIELEKENEQKFELNRHQNISKSKKMALVGLVLFAIGRIIEGSHESWLSVLLSFVGGVIAILGGAVFFNSYIGNTDENQK